MKKVTSNSPEETRSLGSEFAGEIKSGDIIGLKGELGSGKTQFVKGICEHFGIMDDVNSPTFIIVNEYEGNTRDGELIKVYHLDLYRLNKPEELDSLGIDNYLNSGIVLVEWSELMEKYLGRDLKTVSFEHGTAENERMITFE